MKSIIKKIATVQDLAGFGRCSLSVVMPVLSVMGYQVCPIPTAILSTHPGFKEYYIYNMKDTTYDYLEHWKKVGIAFDCIYIGFLASETQVDIMSDFIEYSSKGKRQLVVVDPVLGDHGKLYKICSVEMQKKIHRLLPKADVITPNLTEACLLLGYEYIHEPLDNGTMKKLLVNLSNLGPDNIVITGVQGKDGEYCNIAYSKSMKLSWKVNYCNVPKNYPGTGDIFTSVLTGRLLKAEDLPKAMDYATKFTSQAVKKSFDSNTKEMEGVLLESELGNLLNEANGYSYTILD